VGGTNHVAIITDTLKFTSKVQVFDAATGGLVREMTSPMRRTLVAPQLDPVQRKFLFSDEVPDPNDGAWRKGLFILDVVKGEWRRVSDLWMRNAMHHPTRPWLLFQAWAPSMATTTPIVVFDYEAQKEVFRRDLPIWNLPEPAPFFAGEERVAIPYRGPLSNPSRSGRRSVEVWRIGEPPMHESTTADVHLGRAEVRSASASRVAFADTSPAIIHVFDTILGRVVFSGPTPDRFSIATLRAFGMPAITSGLSSPTISGSGRRVFGSYPATLWDIDSGLVVWKAGPHEMAWGADSDEQFQVIEKWSNLWTRWLPNATLQYVTYAFRSLETGALIYRIAEKVPLRPSNRNAAGTLAVADDGRVYRLPFAVNWMLLALCQLVLAMPLVGLWAVMRWRRARRAKHVSATMSPLASASS